MYQNSGTRVAKSSPTTVTLWEAAGDPLQTLSSGQIVGTGSMGTTYVIEGQENVANGTVFPVTSTLIVSEFNPCRRLNEPVQAVF